MELNVRIAGEAGAGIQTTAELFGKLVMRCGIHVSSYNNIESRIRGGLNFTHLRCSDMPRRGVTNRVDVLVGLSKLAVETHGAAVAEGGVVVCSPEFKHGSRLDVDIVSLAKEAGSPRTQGIVAVAVVAGLMGLDVEELKNMVRQRFAKREDLVKMNLLAVDSGYDAGTNARQDGGLALPPNAGKGRMWISGGVAIGLGAVAGGMTFISSYPMSPATITFTCLAQWAEKAGIVSVQGEDEVGVINMVAGASYAGARAMAATSGGGFALMTEGVSLLGVIETPAVIVVAQRPGPGTGMAARTAQGDLHMVLHSGHGVFPRVILAPKDVADCFYLTARAFDIAEKYQVPVFIMTDHKLQHSMTNVKRFSLDELPAERHLLTTDELEAMDDYARFRFTDSGVSPMAAPGASRHTVVVDSHEHDEHGHLTESASNATAMNEKRMRKGETLKEIILPLEIDSQVDGRPLVVTWGSTYHTAKEAVEKLRRSGIECAHVNLRMIWPIDGEALRELFLRAEKVIVVENNPNGELARLLQTESGELGMARVNRSDGRAFTIDDLVVAIGKELGE